MSPSHSRRTRDLAVGVVLGLAVGATQAIRQCRGALVQPAPASAGAAVSAVRSIGIVVSDLDRSVEFYTGVLGFARVGEHEHAGKSLERLTGIFGARVRVATLRLGEETITLTQYLAPEGRPVPADSRSNDRWFQHIAIVVSDMDRAYARLREHRVRHASSGPQTLPAWNPGAGGIAAFYFKDPDGHVLEVIHFPSGKGEPKWHATAESGDLFLGIDHTAIVVADTERSLAFYGDTLGLRIAGTSENYGTEQEHLNNVFGARLRITSLRAQHGPGIELLEYLAPGDGREYPRDAKSNDAYCWTTTLICSSDDALGARLQKQHARWISPGWIGGVEEDVGTSMAAELRDPDGHALVLGRTDAGGQVRAARGEP